MNAAEAFVCLYRQRITCYVYGQDVLPETILCIACSLMMLRSTWSCVYTEEDFPRRGAVPNVEARLLAASRLCL